MDIKPILLVEDNEDDEALALRTIQKHQFHCEVIVARDGVEALDFLLSTGSHAGRQMPAPVLVMLDLKLPKLDGIEVLRQIRSNDRTKNLPVVIFTSSSEAHDIAECYDLGANSYVRKPVEYSQFSETVKLMVAYWLSENIPPLGDSCNRS